MSRDLLFGPRPSGGRPHPAVAPERYTDGYYLAQLGPDEQIVMTSEISINAFSQELVWQLGVSDGYFICWRSYPQLDQRRFIGKSRSLDEVLDSFDNECHQAEPFQLNPLPTPFDRAGWHQAVLSIIQQRSASSPAQ